LPGLVRPSNRNESLLKEHIPPARSRKRLSRRSSSRRVPAIERRISSNHSSPKSLCYDQETDESILLSRGAARPALDGESTIVLVAGSFSNIPAHRRSELEWTDPLAPTIGLVNQFAAREGT
jgi:hypothetical protein